MTKAPMTRGQAHMKQALRKGGIDLTAKLFERVPPLGDMVQGAGPLTNPWDRSNWTVDRLAAYLATPAGVSIRLSYADRLEYQLLALALWHGGAVDLATARTETGLDVDQLTRAFDGTGVLLLAERADGSLTVAPEVADVVRPPAPLVRTGMRNVPSRDIGVMLSNLGIESGERKWERLDAIESALRDPNVLARALASMTPEARSIFDSVANSPDGVKVGALYQSRYGAYERRMGLSLVLSYGLAGIDYDDRVRVWLDVLVALNGALFPTWEPVTPRFTEAATTTHNRVPGAVSALERLLAHMDQNAAPALQSGGLGVKSVRSVSKTLDLPSATTGLLIALAIELELIGHVTVSVTGRGRNRRETVECRATAEAQTWSTQPAVMRWERLVTTWLDSSRIPADDKPVERYDLGRPDSVASMLRKAFVSLLGEIPAGMAISRADLVSWAGFRCHGLAAQDDVFPQMLNQMAILGLVPEGNPVAISELTRALIAGHDLAGIVESGSETFIMQADHTIIAPPDLDSDVRSTLGQIARLESEAGAMIFRIDETSMVAAHDSGSSGDEIISFLMSHSSTELPPAVERMIHDAWARHGTIIIGSARTWITSEDPVVLSQAVAVKKAKLTAVNASTAISELDRTKVMSALRDAGLPALDTEATDPSTRVAEPIAWMLRTRRSVPRKNDPAEIARQLFETGITPPPLPDGRSQTFAFDDVDPTLYEI